MGLPANRRHPQGKTGQLDRAKRGDQLVAPFRWFRHNRGVSHQAAATPASTGCPQTQIVAARTPVSPRLKPGPAMLIRHCSISAFAELAFPKRKKGGPFRRHPFFCNQRGREGMSPVYGPGFKASCISGKSKTSGCCPKSRRPSARWRPSPAE